MLIGFAAAVVLGLAAGTGAVLVLAPPGAGSVAGDSTAGKETAAADSAREPSDSTGANSESGSKLLAGEPGRGPLDAHVDPPVALAKPPAVARRLPAPASTPNHAPAPARPAPDPAAIARAAALKAARERVAKMFTAMEPKGAAAVLEQMNNGEVTDILGAIPERQAAEILEYLSPQRAAAVSRALLHSPRSTS